jgi:hypothetical protein
VRFVDSGGWRGPTRLTRRGKVSGSGSARLGLSQKGDLPSSGEWIVFIWSKAADARKSPNKKGARIGYQGFPSSCWSGGSAIVLARRTGVIAPSREGSRMPAGTQQSPWIRFGGVGYPPGATGLEAPGDSRPPHHCLVALCSRRSVM